MNGITGLKREIISNDFLADGFEISFLKTFVKTSL